MQSLAVAVIGIPFLGAVACLAVRDKASKYVAVATSVLTAIAAIALSVGMPRVTALYGGQPWLGPAASKGVCGYQLDPLAILMMLASTVIGVAITIYSIGYLSPGNHEHPTRSGQARYYFWLMLFVGSMVGIALSPTLLQLLIFWEMTTLCSWALISIYDNPESLKAGMKALVMTSLGGLFFIGGLVWVMSATGSMSFSALGLMSPNARAGAFALFLIAAWAKSAQVPFHTWLPDAMAAPTPISAYLHAAAMVKAGVFLTARLLLAGWHLPSGMGLLISIAALVTMFAALYLYFFQDDIKRLLAYSTIAQLGYIFLGLGIGTLGADMASRGAVLHILMHACAKTTLFLTVGAIAYATGTRSMAKLSGLGRSMPIAAVGFFVGAFALTGIPPLACFWSKMYVLAGALQVAGAFGPVALILVLIESLIAFGWFLWVGQKVFFGVPTRTAKAKMQHKSDTAPDAQPEPVGAMDPPPSMDWVLIGMIILTLVAPLVGIPLVSHLSIP
ncbi:MAG: hydrogenase 4 subunit D [Armatimonadetes bacterium]|nr:hydrogenase 4 subunit D [Armatimonadota bacterium]